MSDVELELANRIRRGQAAVLATVIRLDGQPPSHTGAKALLEPGSIVAGTLGCSEFDAQALRDAERILADGQPELVTYAHDLGSIEVYLEPHVAAPLLVVFGDSPVGRRVAQWAAEAGFEVSRPATAEEIPRLAGREVFAVHTDHDDPALVEKIEAILRAGPRFVGVMGSRRHTGHHLEELARRGLDPSAIQTPVGVAIGAVTADEIAISILAGVVAARRGGQRLT